MGSIHNHENHTHTKHRRRCAHQSGGFHNNHFASSRPVALDKQSKEQHMKNKNEIFVRLRWWIHARVRLASLLCLISLACLAPSRTSAQTVGEKASAVASETKEKIQEAGKTATRQMGSALAED
jgi:hypothetical protein